MFEDACVWEVCLVVSVCVCVKRFDSLNKPNVCRAVVLLVHRDSNPAEFSPKSSRILNQRNNNCDFS